MMREIQAAVLRETSAPFQIERLQMEAPRHDEVQVRIVGAGICHTDVKMAEGYLPLPLPVVLGHEGAGIVTAIGSAVRKVQVGDHAVFGTGSVGLSAVMAAVIAGATTIIAIDLNEGRLALAQELGATHALNPQNTPDLVAAVKEICGGKGAHYSLDTTNLPAVVRQAFDCLRIRGTYAHVGGTGTELTFSSSQLLFGSTIMGIVQGDSIPDIFIPRLIELYRRGQFPFDRLVTYYDFANINQAVADMHAGTTIKPILRMPN